MVFYRIMSTSFDRLEVVCWSSTIRRRVRVAYYSGGGLADRAEVRYTSLPDTGSGTYQYYSQGDGLDVHLIFESC